MYSCILHMFHTNQQTLEVWSWTLFVDEGIRGWRSVFMMSTLLANRHMRATWRVCLIHDALPKLSIYQKNKKGRLLSKKDLLSEIQTFFPFKH